MARKAASRSGRDKRWTVIVVPHTHWDRAWYLTFEQFRIRLVRLTDKLINVLNSDSRYKTFVFDGQTVVVEDYLEIRPECADELKRLVQERRIWVGPWYVLPDEFLVSPEALVRNLMVGHKIASRMGRVMKVGYIPDPFGHVAQLPQILQGFGIDSAIFMRGVGDEGEKLRGEFWWVAPDGKTKVLAVHQIGGYCNAVHLGYVRTEAGFRVDYDAALRRTRELAERMKQYATTSVLLFNNGCDHVEPQPELPDIIAYVNRNWDEGKLRIGTFADFLRLVRSERTQFESYEGEFRAGRYNYLLSGVFSARMPIKQANHRVQTLLERYAEPAAALAWLIADQPYPDAHLWYAWRTLMKNHPHDDICGCSIDQVHREDMYRFDLAQQVGEVIARESSEALLKLIDASSTAPSDDYRAFAVFNPLPWLRSEVVRITLPADARGVWRDVAGRILAAYPVRSGNETCWWVKVNNIPALGYTTIYFDQTQRRQPQMITDIQAGSDFIENDLYRVTANPNGTVDILDKTTGKLYKGALLFEDAEDAGDEYDYSPITNTQVLTTADERAVISVKQFGPVAATMTVKLNWRLPEGLTEDRHARSSRMRTVPITTTVTLYSGMPRVDFRTTVDNRVKDHRLRVLFPTDIRTDHVIVEGHFHILKRPLELPVGDGWVQKPLPTNHQNAFSEVNDGERGFALINQGLPEYEVRREGDGTTLCLTLLRCVGWLSRGDLLTRAGNAGPSIPTPDAQCIGEHTFCYAVTMHKGNYVQGRVQRRAHEHNTPVVVSEVPADGEKKLPAALSFLSVEPVNIFMTTLKKCEWRNSLIVRFYNASDEPQTAILRPFCKPDGVYLTNMNEERLRGGRLKVATDGSIAIPCDPYEIKTVELVYESQKV